MKDQHADAEVIHALKEALTNLIALAARRGRLDEYRAALDVARAAIAKAEDR